MRTCSFLVTFGAWVIAACGGAATPAAPVEKIPPAAKRDDGGVDVILTSADGVKLAATHWAGPAANERCVVFVHQLGSTREEWGPLIERLARRYEILALDLRGHGGSTRGPTRELSWRRLHERDWEAAVRDVEAAERWLGERGFRAEDCAYVGSSIGASLVVRFAAERPGTAVVLLSPGLAYRGLVIADAAARQRGARMIVVSEEPGPAATADELERLWGGEVERLEVAGNAHGMAMVADQPALLDAIAGFIDRALTPAPSPQSSIAPSRIQTRMVR